MSLDADLTRRDFLKAAGAATAASFALAPLAEASQQFEGNPDRLGVLTDTTLCIGLNCRRCEIACAKEQGLPPIEKPPEDESVFHEIRRMHADQYTVVNRFPNPQDPHGHPIYVKRQCMHCDEPACASACFVKALRKSPAGPVTYDASVCVGCRYCMVACPFDVPAYEYDKALKPRVRKCTLCDATRLSAGEAPACVQACPKEVMTFGKRGDLIELAYEKIAANPDRYGHHVYGEHEVGGSCWLFIGGVPFDKIGFPMDLGVTPYPEYTRAYLSAAPLIMAMWPAFFAGIYLMTKRRDELMRQERETTERPPSNTPKGGM